MSIAVQVAAIEEEIDRLRSALARAEEAHEITQNHKAHVTKLLDESEKRETELRLMLECSEKRGNELETQLATIVERTAKAQREACLVAFDGQCKGWPCSREFVREGIAAAPLVTLSTLPEADSSGGGEEASVGTNMKMDPVIAAVMAQTAGANTAACRHCGGRGYWLQPGSTVAGGPCFYCIGTRFDPAPPKSEPEMLFKCHECKRIGVKVDEDGCCATCGHDCDLVPAPDGGGEDEHPIANLLRAQKAAAEPKAEAIDEWNDSLCTDALDWAVVSARDWKSALQAIKGRNARIAELDKELEAAWAMGDRERARRKELEAELETLADVSKSTIASLERQLAEPRGKP